MKTNGRYRVGSRKEFASLLAEIYQELWLRFNPSKMMIMMMKSKVTLIDD